MLRSRGWLPFALILLLSPGACEDPTAPEITSPGTGTDSIIGIDFPGAGDGERDEGSAPALIECPVAEARSITRRIGLFGGVLSVDGHSVSIPFGALLWPKRVTLSVPASPYAEIDVDVDGEEHFRFLRTIAMTISYDRCERPEPDLEPLTAWYIDAETKELLEPMPSLDNKLLNEVTFTTIHLSGYAIAD